MPIYTYIAKDQKGKTLAGTVEVPTLDEARKLLREKQYILISLQEKKESWLALLVTRFRGVPLEQKSLFARQLATMVGAGLPFASALEVLRNQTTNPRMKEVLIGLYGDVQGGAALSESMRKYPDVFSPTFVALTSAGEASGKLEQTLLSLADTLEKMRDFRAKLIGALIYPILIFLVMGVVFVVMVLLVLPRISVMYESLDAPMPLPTLIFLGIANIIGRWWWLLGLLLGLGIFAFRQFVSSAYGRYKWDAFVLKIPVFGMLSRETQLADFCRTVGLLLGAGVPITQALEITAAAMGNVHFRDAILNAEKQVEKGIPLSKPLGANPNFPPILTQMIGVGEETGKMDQALDKMAEFFASEVERGLHNITVALEPLIIIVLGVLVGVFVISILVPIYNLVSII